MPKMPQSHLVIYDNGESYEDHREYPLAITFDKDAADALASALTEWIERARAKYPTDPLTVEGISDEEFVKMADAQSEYLAKLRPPLGEDCLKHSVSTSNGTVLVVPLPLFPDLATLPIRLRKLAAARQGTSQP